MLKTLFLTSLLAVTLVPTYAIASDAATVVSQADSWTSPHDLSVEAAAPVALIPFPQQVQWHSGELVTKGKTLTLEGDVQGLMMQTAKQDYLAGTKATDATIKVVCTLKADALPADKSAEGYILQINGEGITITAVTEAGLFNGFQTLRQMMATGKESIPYCNITDWPAFRYRGFMQDCGRNFRSVERLKKELSLAEWHCRGAIPTQDDHFTITREMIRIFDEGQQPG